MNENCKQYLKMLLATGFNKNTNWEHFLKDIARIKEFCN